MSVETVSQWMEEAATSVLSTEEAYPSYPMYLNEQGEATETLFYDDGPHTYFVIKDGQRIDVPGVTTVLKGAIDKSYALIPWGTKLAVETIRARIFAADGGLVSLSTEEWNALLDEAKNKHREKLEDAGDIGSAVHNCLEEAIKFAIKETGGYITSTKFAPALPNGYVQGSDLQLELRTSMAHRCFLAALDWCRRHRVEFLHTERKIFSRSHFFAGTTDGIANVTICDDLGCCGGHDDIGSRVQGIIDWKSSAAIRDTYALQAAAYQFAAIEELGLPITHRFINRLGKEDGKFESWVGRPSLFADDVDTFLSCLRLYNSYEKLKTRRAEEKAVVKAKIKQQKEDAKLAAKQAEQAEREAKRLLKLAEVDAKKAIRQAEKEERAAAKQAKPAGLVLVPNNIPVLDAEPKSDDHPSTPFEAKAKLTTEGRTGTANIPTGTNSTPNTAPSSTKLDEDFWAGGFGIDASGKQVAVAAKQDKAQPGIAQTVQASAEPRAMTRFWSLTSSTYTGRTM